MIRVASLEAVHRADELREAGEIPAPLDQRSRHDGRKAHQLGAHVFRCGLDERVDSAHDRLERGVLAEHAGDACLDQQPAGTAAR